MDENVRTNNVRNDAHGQPELLHAGIQCKGGLERRSKNEIGRKPGRRCCSKGDEIGLLLRIQATQALNRFIQ